MDPRLVTQAAAQDLLVYALCQDHSRIQAHKEGTMTIPVENVIEWARENGKPRTFKSYVTRRLSDQYVYGTAYEYEAEGNSTQALLFVDGVRRFPKIEQGSVLFIVGDITADDKPPRIFYLVSFNRAEGWFIAHEVTNCRSTKYQMPPHVTYYVGLD
jgi:hypothetical protein